MKSHLRLMLAAAVMANGAFAQINGWTTIYIHGKVTMEDGSPPPKRAAIARRCSDEAAPGNVAFTDNNGLFTWKMDIDIDDSRRCDIWAELVPYKSNRFTIPDLNAFSDPNLPPLVLSKASSAATADTDIFSEDARVPSAAQAGWKKAQLAARAGRWAEAERSLNAAVLASPRFARGWNALAALLERENKPADAWKDYRRAVDADPKLLPAYVSLARLSLEVKDWDNASQVTGELIKRDADGTYPEARLIASMAHYEMKDWDGAAANAKEAIRMDTKHRMPSAEYLLGISLGSKRDYDGAREHLNRYLELMPRSANADAVKQMIANLEKMDLANAPPPELALSTSELPTGVPGEAWVPGGRKALAEIAGLKDASSYENFFGDYCRILAREMSVGTSRGIPRYLDAVRAYMAAVTDLLSFGERKGDITTVTISLASENQRKTAERVLPLLGWKLVSKDGAFTVEPGDQPADGLHQHLPKAFGIDEIGMQETLEGGKSFQFDIPTENARVVGGNDWSPLLKELPSIPGGIASAFTLDVRVAKTYAGLGAMKPDAAAALIRAVGVRNLVLRYSDVLARYGDALEVSKAPGNENEFVAVPGGAAAEPVWKKLTGASPRDPAQFFRALLEKNEGRLAAFYFAVWSADKAHQEYFTKTEARADRFYAWYRDSEEFKFGLNRHVPGWRTELFQKLQLDAEGNVRFPGGKRAWTNASGTEEEVVTGLKTLEALVPMEQMEQRRAAPLDEASVTLLAQHYSEWGSLFPYFEKLPALGREEFASLQAFAAVVSKQPPATQNVVLGEWYSMVELIARGSQAGSLDASASARAFRRTCEGLSKDDHSAQAITTLREIAGGANLSQAVPANLLRLNPERRSAFERVLELQGVPRIDAAPDPSKVAAALSGFVYAAAVDPDALLISEDTQLLSRHRFTTAEPNDKSPLAFVPAALVGSNTPPGSFLKGGFVNIQEVASEFVSGGRSVPPITLASAAAKGASGGSGPLLAKAENAPSTGDGSDEVIFHSKGRLVEAYATVTDSRGRYVDDLTVDQFKLIDGQQAQNLVAFESQSNSVSVALLLDTTGSMSMALPAVKNAALKLIADLRPIDSVAVYSFSRSVNALQPFTSDMDLAKRAVLTTQPMGETALYDALARVSRDLSGRTGKKVIVLFTDGEDNASTLTMDTAILRVKAAGVPVYTIAQGEALEGACHTQTECRNPSGPPVYIKQLADLAKVTGGESFAVREASEIGGVFQKISEDLAHGYLLVFQPPSVEGHVWHPITVQVPRGLKVRPREGYYPE